MKNVLDYLNKHLPVVLGAALVVVQFLVDNGSLVLAPHALALVNAVLVASGLGVLHVRQQ